MEPVEAFVEIFERSKKNKDNEALVRIFKEANRYLQNISKNNGERALEILLDKQKGLLKFIQNTLQNTFSASCNSPLKECFGVLHSVIELFKNDFEPYIMQTRDICIYCIRAKCWFYARKSAAETLRKLIETFPNYDMQLHKIIEHYNDSYLKLYSTKDGCVFYIVIGAIAKYCPKTKNLDASVDSLFLQILKDLKSQYKPANNKQPDEIKIYLECLFDIFENFTPLDRSSKKSECFKHLYSYISKLCEPDKAQKYLRSKSIYFLSTYMKHFAVFVFNDYEKWHKLLTSILEETDTYTVIGALKAFYQVIALQLLQNIRGDIFFYFKNYFTVNFRKKNLPLRNLRLIIYGMGELSITYAKYSPTEIHELFRMIALETVHFYEMEDTIDESCELIADHLQTLSKILVHTPKVTPQQVDIITELSIFLNKHFPTFSNFNKPYVAKTLKITFVNISQLDKNLQAEYFGSFFREGVLWLCSSVNSESNENIQDYSIHYRNYFPLWHSLFDVSNQDNAYRFAMLQIFNEFVHVLITFIDKLNINVRICENEFESEASFPLEPENETDFQFFINLVCLYVDVFEKIESFIFENSMEKLLMYFIKYSYKYPLIPGFYKLIESIFRKVDTCSDLEEYFRNSTCELITQYLSDVLKLIGGFSDDLQLSCINLIFNIPPVIVPSLIDEMIPIFKIALTIGLSNTSLAVLALDTLENWMRCSTTSFSNDFFKNIVQYLEPYISNGDNSIETFQGIVKKKRNTRKNILLINDDDSLENLQKKILLFYGSIDSDIPINLVYEKSLQTNASWTKKSLLQCELFFPDIRLEINFDKFIPRILDITRSSELKSKVAACEFLHAMITVMLGKKISWQCLTKNLFDAVLKLGCDPNDSIRNLFHPLIIQLTHFFNSKLMKDSKVPSVFLDSIFEGLTDEYNPLLRDYCGLYLKEFTQWSIKQSTDIHGINSSNIEDVISRISSWALYPSNKKRIGAAIAFNNLYTVLRDNTYVVNAYWLELLYVFLKCLRDCDDVEIMSALNHLEKVIKVKSNLFNAKSDDRKKPPDFQDVTLKSLLIWLLRQCSSTNSKYRLKCMELFENLLTVVSDKESFKTLIAKDINDIALKNLEDDTLNVGIEKANNLVKALQFYSWILKKKFLEFDARSIFDEEQSIFSKCFNQFVSVVNRGNLFTLDKKFENVAGEITSEILSFVSLILLEQDLRPGALVWNHDLYSLIARCTLRRREIGLTAKQFQITDELPQQLEILLSRMMQNLSEIQLRESRDIFCNEAKKYLTKFSEISDIVDLEVNIEDLEEFLNGLLLLKKLNFIDFDLELGITYSYSKTKINDIFKTCKIRILDTDSCKKFDEQAKSYLQKLMNLLLKDEKIEVTQDLIEFIINDDKIDRPKGSTVSHGEYFLEIFREPLFRCMLKNINETMIILDDYLVTHPDKMFFLIEELLIFGQRNKTIDTEILSDAIITRCNRFQRFLNDIEERKTRFFNINRIAVTLRKKPTEAIQTKDFYTWILDELVKAQDLERKSTILKSFLICLTDEESNEMNPELSLIFQQLRDNDSASCLRKFESNEIEKFQAASCFQVLLKMLVSTKSIVIYKAVMKFSAGIYKCLFKENVIEYLTLYFNSISEEKAFKSIELAYKTFMDLNSSIERLDVLRYFLIPSIELAKIPTIEKFYESNCQELAHFVSQTINASNNLDRIKAVVTKIGSYNIFEVLFAKFELTFIKVHDPVTKSGRPVNQLLVQQSVEVRCLSAMNDQEAEIIRLLHCAALNCCISVIALKRDEKFYKFVFTEDRKKNQLIWEKIVDLEKRYNLSDTLSTIRRDRKKLINIRKRVTNDEEDLGLRRFTQPVTLTLLEDIHAYDLNDTRILSESSKVINQESEKRLDLSLINDELNNHECMPMLTGILTDLLKNLGEIPKTDLPISLKFLRNAFVTKKDNSRLFLMKLITNVKDYFGDFVKPMFTAIVTIICGYLKNNNLNIIVRDIIVLLLESKCRLDEGLERKAAQALLEHLIERASDLQEAIYKYNLELIEAACKLWKEDGLSCPIDKLEGMVIINPELVIRTALILFRCEISGGIEIAKNQALYNVIKSSLNQPWLDDESKLLRRFEILGHFMRLSPENDNPDWLKNILINIEKRSCERSCRCVYALYKGCRGKNLGSLKISRFANDTSRLADTHKPDCLELFVLRMNELDPEVGLPVELIQLGLKNILKERIPGCENAAMAIIERLIPLFRESDLSNYIQLLSKNYTSARCCPLEFRQKAYHIIAETYLKHGCNNPGSPLSKLCAKYLIQGLSSDPANEIREELLKYWLKFGLPSRCSDRLLALLDFYEPELGESFPRFFCLLILQLTSESDDNDRTMFKSLGDDDPSFSESNTLSIRLSTLCRKRRTLLLGPSLLNRSSQSLGPSQNTSRMSTAFSWGATIQPMSRREKMSKDLNPMTNFAPKYRTNYKFSDYPDVELIHANFVETLKNLAANDWLSCRHLAASIICSLVERSKTRNQNFLSRLTTKFEQLLFLEQQHSSSGIEESSHFIAVMLETMMQSQELRLHVDVAAKLSRTARLSTLGVLLLEQDLIDQKNIENTEEEQPAAKRPRINTKHNEKESWIELSNLYKSIGELDIAKCIASREGLFSEEFRKGALAQVENDWLTAKNAYEQSLDDEKEYCFEASLECLAHLSSWGEINEKIATVVHDNWNSAWKHPKRDLLLPWILEAQLNKALEDLTANKEPENRAFLDRFDEWLRAAGNDIGKIGTLLPQELIALLLLCDKKSKNDSTPRQYLKSSLDQLREQWIRLSPLSKNLRTDVLIRLRGIFNIHAYVETLRDPDVEDATRSLIKYWDQRLPRVGQDLHKWNVHVLHRLTFAHLLHEKFDRIDDENDVGLSTNLLLAGVRQRMAIGEMAIVERNNTVAKKHMGIIERTLYELTDEEVSKLTNDFTLMASKYKFICGEKESRASKKCKYYVNSWKIAEDLLEEENLDIATKINTINHLFDLTMNITNLAQSHSDFLECLIENDYVLEKLDLRNPDDFFASIENYSFNILKNTCEDGNDRDMAESYTKFGKYCYNLLQENFKCDTTLSQQFISSILTGMSLGSLGSTHYFPCLLKCQFYQRDEQATEIFNSKSKNVPSWLFLSWQAQIISHLNGPLSKLLLPIIQRLARDYPSAIMYNFRSSYETRTELRNNPEMRNIHEILFSDAKIEFFLDEMHRLCQPEYYVQYHLLRFIEHDEGIDSLFDKIAKCQGSLYKVLDNYREEFEKLKTMDVQTAKKHAIEISRNLYDAMKHRLKNFKNQGLLIKDYSTYLSNFLGEDLEIEVPSQYIEGRKPMPQYHTKISRFDKNVRIMESKRNPMKISIVGNDAQVYSFLVKFGEDLRQDQRLQQIFRITNKTLENDNNCKKRYLTVNTYDVIPLSSTLGLIEWVDDTRSFRDFVEFSMSDKTLIDTVSMEYRNWIEKAGKSEQVGQMYKDALIKYNSDNVVSKMKELINNFDSDFMKKTFFTLSTTAECFLTLRQNFITSYATMCIVHWITGIGDRHLENTLIQVKTGKCYGIDFESAFGIGIDQAVPELVPFRLTAQILGLFKPFDEYALFGTTMTHVLSALRKERGPTLACLDSFIYEPVDWWKHMKNRNREELCQDTKWLPQKKIAIVAKKLNGEKPSKIMLKELSNMHGQEEEEENRYYLKYKEIVSGQSYHKSSIRSRMKNEFLTPEEQVQCLLEQAKDLNLLGRMWVGWCPFV